MRPHRRATDRSQRHHRRATDDPAHRRVRLRTAAAITAIAIALTASLALASLSTVRLTDTTRGNCEAALAVRDAFRDVLIDARGRASRRARDPRERAEVVDFYNDSIARVDRISCAH